MFSPADSFTVFNFKTFLGTLQLDAPIFPDNQPDRPVLILFTQDGEVSFNELKRMFSRLLSFGEYKWIRPIDEDADEWLIDLTMMRSQFSELHPCEYLKGKLKIIPVYKHIPSKESYLRFTIQPEAIHHYFPDISQDELDEIRPAMQKFHKYFTDPDRCGFLMMKFEDTRFQKEIVQIVREHFRQRGFEILRADDRWLSDDLFTNVKAYMHGCKFGVALFERVNSNDFNPNVSLEIGYMLALRKPILYLKEKSLEALQSDLIGKLYSEFDYQNMESSLALAIDKWLHHQEMRESG